MGDGWYDTNFHTSLKLFHFKALYSYNPPHMAFIYKVTTSVTAVEEYLKERDVMLDLLKDSLHSSQERMKHFA